MSDVEGGVAPPVMSGNTAVVHQPEQVDPYIQRMKQLGTVLHGSKLFPGTTGVLQAMVKAMFGEALGLTPAESQWGLHTISGKPPSLSAVLVGARIKASGRYDYRVMVMTNERCVLDFYEKLDGQWERRGSSEFTIEDAKRAGLLDKTGSNYKPYPRPLLFSRALTGGARVYCPDVFFGNGIYTPEELGIEPEGRKDLARVQSQMLGEVVDPEFTVVPDDGEEVAF